MRKKKRRSDRKDEPGLPEGDWYGYCDDSIWIVGHTRAGFPYGPRRSDMLKSLEHEAAGAGWARAKMGRLLEAYARHGGRPVEAKHVHVHEIAMAAAQYRDSLRPGGGEPSDQPLARLRSLLRRLDV